MGRNLVHISGGVRIVVQGMIALLQGETTVVVQEAATSGIGLSELLSGFIGALIVFGLQFLQGRLRRRRELTGLARLVHNEITHNDLTLHDLYLYPKRALTDVTVTLRLDIWESARVRLAEMMPADNFGSLAYYYLFLQELKHIQANQALHQNPIGRVKNALEQMEIQERDATEVALAYANLRGLLGWYWMRRQLSKDSRSTSEAEQSQEPPPREPNSH